MNMPCKLEPHGLKQSPIKPIEIPLHKVEETTAPPIDSHVGWVDLLRLWVKENLINDIFNSQKPNTGVYMSKAWYTSKTIWFNLLSAVWFLVGPYIGVPVLDADTFATILIVINTILRVVTKGGVTIS